MAARCTPPNPTTLGTAHSPERGSTGRREGAQIGWRMTTLRENLEQRFCENGLWPDEAKAVLDLFVEELKETEPYMHENIGRRQADEYPAALSTLLYLRAKKHAVRYIDENKPQHWARPMFAE